MSLPIEPHLLIAFTAASLVLLAVPGPTIVMVVSQALTLGHRVAFASVLGVGLGDLAAVFHLAFHSDQHGRHPNSFCARRTSTCTHARTHTEEEEEDGRRGRGRAIRQTPNKEANKCHACMSTSKRG